MRFFKKLFDQKDDKKRVNELVKKKDVEDLIKDLSNQDVQARRIAARELGITKDPRAVEPLITALKDEDVTIREAAAKSLWSNEL